MQIIILFFIFIVFPLCGIQALQKGEVGSAILFILPVPSDFFILKRNIILNFDVLVKIAKTR